MKKHFLPLLLALLLIFSAAGEAWADNTMIINLGSAEAGAYVDRLLGTTDRGSAAINGGALPEGCQVVSEERDGGAYHYLRGTPMTAGDFEFTLVVTAPAAAEEEVEVEPEEPTEPEEPEEPEVPATELIAELQCSLSVLPAAPSLSVSPDVNVQLGEEASLAVAATVPDGGTLSYQWYLGTSRSDRDGSPVSGAVSSTLRVTPAEAGTSWYYCVVTNTNNGRTTVSASQTVAVTAEAVLPVSLAVLQPASRLEFTVDERLDTTGLQLLLTYSDGRSETVGAGFTAEPSRLGKVGRQTVTIRYAGLSCSYDVLVKETEEVVLGLQLIDLPKKLDYQVGDWLDPAGMTLRVDTNKGSYDVSTGYSCTPRLLDKEGRQTVTVSYSGETVSFTVNVAGAEKRVESIAIQRRPAKLSYRVGDSFDPLGLTLMVQTNQGAEEITEGFTWSPQQFSYAGRQELTLSYEGRNCTLELIVEPSVPAITPLPAETPAPTAEPEPVPTDTPRPDSSVPRRSGRLAAAVLVIAAFTGLAALGGYAWFTRREKVLAVLQALREKLHAAREALGQKFGKKK